MSEEKSNENPEFVKPVPVESPEKETGDDITSEVESRSEDLTVDEAMSEMAKWGRDGAERKRSDLEKCLLDPVKDIEKYGFVLEKRTRSDDPFIFYKPILLDSMPDRNWKDHGYFLRLVLLIPFGTVMIHVLDITDRYHVVKKSEEDRSMRNALLPCSFQGVVRTSKELDSVMEFCFLRDPMFDFYPSLPVPHQNVWVEWALQMENTKPVQN